MRPSVNLVDSSAWLAYFANEPSAGFFAKAVEDEGLLVVPSVCVHEVFKVVLRERGEGDSLDAGGPLRRQARGKVPPQGNPGLRGTGTG